MYARALTATILAATASQAHAQRLDAALRDTLVSDPEIAGAEAGVRGAEANVDIVRSTRSPVVAVDARAGYRVDDTLIGPRRRDALGVGLSLDIPLYTGGEFTWRVRSARAALTAEQAQRDLTVNMRLATTAERYANLYRDGQIEAARETQVANVATLLTATRARERAGASTATDSHQAVARLELSRARLAQARAALTRSQEDLREVSGSYVTAAEPAEPPALPAAMIDDLPAQLPDFPAMKLAQARIDVARADIRVARSGRSPRLYLSGQSSAANDLITQTSVPARFLNSVQFGLRLSVPLFQGGIVGARVRQAEQQLAVRQDEKLATERELVSAIRGQFAQLEAVNATLPALVTALDASKAALVGVKTEILVGARSELDVLNAQEEVTQTEIQLAQVRQQRLALAYSILGMIGRLAPAEPARASRTVQAVRVPTVAAPVYAGMMQIRTADGKDWSLTPGRRIA